MNELPDSEYDSDDNNDSNEDESGSITIETQRKHENTVNAWANKSNNDEVDKNINE